jgi:metal-responsive CopG/Arc/MetJ family transcriptional regulator
MTKHIPRRRYRGRGGRNMIVTGISFPPATLRKLDAHIRRNKLASRSAFVCELVEREVAK